MLLVADDAGSFAGHFDAFAMRGGVCDGDEFVGGNVRLLIESQEPTVGHRHVHGDNQIALGDDHGRERMAHYERRAFVAAYFLIAYFRAMYDAYFRTMYDGW